MADPLIGQRLRQASLRLTERTQALAERAVDKGDVELALVATALTELALVNVDLADALIDSAQQDLMRLERLLKVFESHQQLMQTIASRGGPST